MVLIRNLVKIKINVTWISLKCCMTVGWTFTFTLTGFWMTDGEEHCAAAQQIVLVNCPSLPRGGINATDCNGELCITSDNDGAG